MLENILSHFDFYYNNIPTQPKTSWNANIKIIRVYHPKFTHLLWIRPEAKRGFPGNEVSSGANSRLASF